MEIPTFPGIFFTQLNEFLKIRFLGNVASWTWRRPPRALSARPHLCFSFALIRDANGCNLPRVLPLPSFAGFVCTGLRSRKRDSFISPSAALTGCWKEKENQLKPMNASKIFPRRRIRNIGKSQADGSRAHRASCVGTAVRHFHIDCLSVISILLLQERQD